MSSVVPLPAGAPGRMHEALRVLVENDRVAVQPANAAGSGGSADTLGISLRSGAISCGPAPALGSSADAVLALLGVFTLKAGVVLAFVTGAEQVAVIYGQPVFRVTDTRIIKPHGAAFDAGEQRLMSLLSQGLSPHGAGRNLFFAYNVDLTLNAQALSDALAAPGAGSSSIAARADRRFFWNRELVAPLLAARADAFVVPMILGSVGQLVAEVSNARPPGVITTSEHKGGAGGATRSLTLTLIARRGLDRAGTRHWRRGADSKGNVANFVESEQLVSLDNGALLASYVQLRGSVPLLWSQTPNIKYKPPTLLLTGGASDAAFDAHVAALLRAYGEVHCINLVNQHGSEGKLEAAFAAAAGRAAAAGLALHYTAFDFHKQCGATNYARLSMLRDEVAPDMKRFGQFVAVAAPSPSAAPVDSSGGATTAATRQTGVFRINCIDCLDRTNVVQGLLGRAALESVLLDEGILAAGQTMAASLTQLEPGFKALWADHGDAISRQYAGTGALKSGFTRTGKRGIGGLLDDGAKSIVRYYLNNFKDGHKQDALDLVSGAYRVKPGVVLAFGRQHGPGLPLALAVAALLYALHAATAGRHTAATPSSSSSSSSSGGAPLPGGASGGLLLLPGVAAVVPLITVQVVGPLLLAGGLLWLVQRHGRALVDRPQLCPALSHTVAAAQQRAAAETNGAAAAGGGGLKHE